MIITVEHEAEWETFKGHGTATIEYGFLAIGPYKAHTWITHRNDKPVWLWTLKKNDRELISNGVSSTYLQATDAAETAIKIDLGV